MKNHDRNHSGARPMSVRWALVPALILAAGWWMSLQAAASNPNQAPNTLSSTEQADGWQLLWDGRTTTGWRSARHPGFPKDGWKIRDGELIVDEAESGGGESQRGGDIITEAEYSAFELQVDFKYATGANSGVKYFVDEKLAPIGGSAIGLEYQIIDDDHDADARNDPGGLHAMASLYDLVPRATALRDGARPKPGVWQHMRIVVRPDNHVEHWLNGVKVLEYVRGSADFRARVGVSKFKDIPGFGLSQQGHLLLQDHGHEVRFRNLKLRVLR